MPTIKTTQREFAKLLGISQQAVSKLANRGVLTPGASLSQWTREAWQWQAEQAAGRQSLNGQYDLIGQRARLAKEQADKTNIEVRKLRGELYPASLWADLFSSAASIIKARLLGLHNKIASRYRLETKVILAIEDECRNLLTELGQERLPAEIVKRLVDWEQDGRDREADEKNTTAHIEGRKQRKKRTPKASRGNQSPRARKISGPRSDE